MSGSGKASKDCVVIKVYILHMYVQASSAGAWTGLLPYSGRLPANEEVLAGKHFPSPGTIF